MMGVRCQLIGRVRCTAGSGYFMREDRRGMGGGKPEGKKKRKKMGNAQTRHWRELIKKING